MRATTELFEGFDYAPEQLKKFIHTAGIFTLMLKNSDKIVTFIPDNITAFHEWLNSHSIADIRITG